MGKTKVKDNFWTRVGPNHSKKLKSNRIQAQIKSSFVHKNPYDVLLGSGDQEEVNSGVVGVISSSCIVGLNNAMVLSGLCATDDMLPAVECAGQTTLEDNHSLKPVEQSNADYLLIGDSILRYSGKLCKENGCTVRVHPGAKIKDLKNKLMGFLQHQPKIIHFHVGTNNLPLKYNGGAGHNGGCCKRDALHCMADLLYTTRIRFPNSVVLVDSILPRSDISETALAQFNEQLELMSGNFGVVFLNWNQLVRRYHLARDGRHLNRKGVSVFGAALLNVYEQLTSCEMASDGGCCLLKPVADGVDAVTRGELDVDDVEVGLLETVVDGVEAVLNVELLVDSDKSGLPRLVDDGNVVQSKNGCETWLNESKSSDEFAMSGYSLFRSDRKGNAVASRGGGVALYSIFVEY
ncbi:hypothetical protein J6590_076063 [Homalodisca vitripennis]|nr:hypothetical protein J6590_076063 [Homalodisca vitripennis]